MADVDWNGPQIEVLLEGASVQGLTLASEYLLQVSRGLVPLDEAILELSGVASVDPDNLIAAVSYDTVYAVRQHEELEWQHAPGRTAKYLEGPMNTERDTMLELIAAQLRREIGG